MTLDYTQEGKVAIKMNDYVATIVDNAPDDMKGVMNTPAAKHLFEVDGSTPRLSEEKAEFFHMMVAKLLFLCKRPRPDISTAIDFLSTRVQYSDQHDYKKLACVIKYLCGTRELFLTLEASNPLVIKWWVDAAFTVHEDMRSHTGGCGSIGKGCFSNTSIKQPLNTKSYTEAEVVGVDQLLSQVMWTQNFMVAQGLEVHENQVLQDNLSAIQLETNGTASTGK